LEVAFAEARASNLGYWHDSGNAQRRENLGLERHERWLDRFGRAAWGARLHDAHGIEDRRPPGIGAVDFRLVREGLSSRITAVIDLTSEVSEEDLRVARLYLAKFGFRADLA
jgi:hypothetical protein